ncbi:acylphosphatase [Microbacterium sp. EYE_5]|uniref:acylphosphatase n=1 Tax=unclassified Microbacterium TaxID=2609290 RepID=UPI002004B7FE|nr:MULTISPECIES: acylphosphatase [unclassified Microbacterium]MCK6080268.1 acylphosphatase [Microbacterium sp. EYE_382]MCK6085539.1 acylphosphatase [Microbacterium sp. EYE_384]MCK6122236.1 acylphosphatase [Microbacterium sp. EYE_80]MCK6126302.1 acylphosphatase [Microbacterium sp. EYE_79]MCK6141223.1 acylphosphatase [Microbacterium sp. EYE_39]
MRRIRLVVRGVVQGVGFRFTMQHMAQQAGATGWVRNRGDGTVQAEVQGTASAVEAVVDWAARGPRGGSVDDVAMTEIEPLSDETGFEIRRDA